MEGFDGHGDFVKVTWKFPSRDASPGLPKNFLGGGLNFFLNLFGTRYKLFVTVTWKFPSRDASPGLPKNFLGRGFEFFFKIARY